jgi:serine/threonine protein kinase
MRNLIGQQLGNYRLLRLLGSGGFADVYLGQHLRLDMYAAMKVLHTSFADMHNSDIQREAQTIANLRHPHIIRLLDFDVFDGVTFLAMEYASGGSVLQKHPAGSVLPLPTVVAYAQQLGAALHYAHTHQVIHRDVKPADILIDQHGALLLGDFGIARLLQHSSSSATTHSIAGTAPYMAPEQVQGSPCPASDQYSLGIVLYEWLCGRRPFLGGPSEIAIQHLVAAPPLLRLYNATLPETAENVILQALAKKPVQRLETVEAFLRAFEAASRERLARLDHSRNEETRHSFSSVGPGGFQEPPPQVEHIPFSSPVQETTQVDLPSGLESSFVL